MQRSKRISIIDLNQHITCKICKGYFVDATTIIECLHTFCRSCIVGYLKSNKYCPVCDVQVHKTKPLLNIRPDKTVQDIVYKLVPRLFQNEMQRRRDFYESHPEAKPSSLEQCGEASYQFLLTPEEKVCLTLSYHGCNSTPRYLRCPAAVSLGHLKKLIQAKYDLNETHRVEILYNQDCLNSSLTLMDVAYIYLWKRKAPIELTYRIYECAAKKPKLEPEHVEASQTNNNNWKEVQLRISENGEMSITGIQDSALSPSLLEIVNTDQKYKNEVVTVVETKPPAGKKELPALKFIGKSTNATSSSESVVVLPTTSGITTSLGMLVQEKMRLETSGLDAAAPAFLTSCATLSSGTTTTVFSTINNSKCSTKSDDPPARLDPAPVAPDTVYAEKAVPDAIEPAVDPTPTPKLEEPEHAPPKSPIPTPKLEEPEPAPPKSPPMLNNNVTEKNLKRKNETVFEAEPPSKQAKPTVLNHSIGLLNLSNNHPLKKHSKMNRNGEPVAKTVVAESESFLSSSSTSLKSDVTFSKPSFVNKNFANVQLGRPGTPIMSCKSSIMSTKASIIPSKVPATFSGAKSPCYMPKPVYNPVINVPKPTTSVKIENNKPATVQKSEVKIPATSSVSGAQVVDGKPVVANCLPPQGSVNANNKLSIKSKPSTPIGYKTLRDPPKSWNSQISKANLVKPPADPKYSDLKNVRPAKFFKMRNNMPRYLGNPASGVKPMYQVHVSPEKDKQQDPIKTEKSEIKKHSIVKIDPKTLKPISEKAPETTSLSNHTPNPGFNQNHIQSLNLTSNHSLNSHNQNLGMAPQAIPGGNHSLSNHNLSLNHDLKINTSSVSIFNPLKLQSSPKNERKSPKSPHSPKLKSHSPTSGKRDKVNLNFTPPNPFIPNLASPTMSPNQFLYPTGPPGFPPYDPRVMAAYHHLWYGQRMGFPASPIPGLSLDLNQRKNFVDMMPSPTSPKMGGMSQQVLGPQISTKLTSTTPSSISSMSRTQSLLPPSTKPVHTSKKTAKESKSEKSIENAVEKLTQNRNKEISRSDSSTSQKRPENREKPQQPAGTEKPPDRVTNKRVHSEGKENKSCVSASSNPSASGLNSSPSSSDKSKSVNNDTSAARPSGTVVADDVKVCADPDCGSVKKSPCIEGIAGSNLGKTEVSNNRNSEEIVDGGK